MSRTVFCRKYQQELPGLPVPPLPGAKGQELYDNVSAKAWQEWLSHQTMLINEKQLNLMDMTARAYLSEQMEKFFANQGLDEIEGYVAPEDK
ncbi:oxidative damage protection protein [Agaribacterium haliotis]|uniref:oxidative damage protection protein n=1 Tax=Agaribacterium haliotis TaxID=2013869 RepID=UPI000BB54E86|nr:oxidative damage protection protein [Agaribacterium haliotis]